MNTSTDRSESSSMSESSSSEEKMVKKRGRPRKFDNNMMKPQNKFSSAIYESPLGFQYINPQNSRMLYVNPMMQRGFYNTFNVMPSYHTNFTNSGHTFGYRHPVQPAMPRTQVPLKKVRKEEERSTYIPERRQKRAASLQRAQVVHDKESSDEEYEEDEDNIEKLLKYDEESDSFFVKFRYLSYLHCGYVKKSEIVKTKTGAIKVKRFKQAPIPFDPDFIKVDRVLHEDYKDGKVFVIKWKKLAYELSTEEKADDVTKCENFEEELRNYRDRKKMRNMRHSLEWRPTREMQVKYEESPEFKGGNKLRAYQLEGLNWLLNRWYFKVSCIMADEMGLGKTVQSVVFINTLFTKFEYVGPVLIVAPLSTLVHWEREFKAWTNLRILTYHGSIQGREVIASYEFYLKANNLNIRLFDILITTYEMVMTGIDHINQFNWSCGIFDEAHRLKNANSKAATILRTVNFSHKVLLSGTPLQNNITELWALLNFINPVDFNDSTSFLNEYKLENSQDVEKLQGLLRPLMLRRMKEDVEKSIPMKEETIIEVELTMIQKRYYRAILEKNMEFLTKGTKESAPNLLNAMMELRKCCIHPYLIKGAEEKIIGDYLKRKRKEEEDTPLLIQDIDEYYKVLIQSSGKLVLLDKLLNKLHGKHKVLIFSQMTRCLDLLGEYLSFRKYKFERIDGGVRGENRQAAIDRFSDGDSDVFVFLLCTRAGGVGINLTAADTVIIFDSDWNPQNDLQAQARCHRIGQTNEVKIYRLVTRNTYEREMFDKAGLKLGLDRAVLQKMAFEGGAPKNEKIKKKDAIEILLRKGAYGVLMETDEASKNFCEEDIDQILERRTKVVKHTEGGNVFSKASFQVDEEIDDPDFWDNLLNKKKNEENEGRVKRQMRRISRDPGFSPLENDEIYSHLEIPLDEEGVNQCLLEFLIVLKFGLNPLGLDFDQDILIDKPSTVCFINKSITEGRDFERVFNFNTPFLYLKYITKFVIDQMQNQRARDDFSYGIDQLLTENYDPSLFQKYKDIYNNYGERFVLRIQTILLLKSLLLTEQLTADKNRGWNIEDDKKLLDSLFTFGYGNYPEKIKNKSSEECNQRIRKIISTLSRMKEMAESDSINYKAIMRFGRITEYNEENILRYLGDRDISPLKEMIDKILNLSKRSRNPSESECYDRIVLFDKILILNEIPILRKGNMPRGWSKEKDEELRKYLIENGFWNTLENFGISEEQAIKRCEGFLKYGNKE
ncbi:Chromodomain-helicase-DNA-binding protein 9 [Nosema bombycis CQ1]|uniref:Chromodomain-helicase-DNA-binding protein 9 n=2 Tax=Nosema bombycis (strain CQ1 / CVCC 102059) TaxID=578461 RepID=R0M8L7_NOSB1|nr:Chromodomain-helicase-DNA-binding protein 9 [Nosema bombycis CQ1]|eukprot:EOB14309.1 Chromodomain-helicase-DNA-binding protein 9 [Nosema bombycis CQ1]